MPRPLLIVPLLIVPLLAALPFAALAGTGYKCVDAQGRISFQDKPCPADAESHAFRYRASSPRDATPTPAPETVVSDDDTPPPPVDETEPPSPPVEPPEYFLCRHYDGKTYYSDDGVTAPYSVPLGVLGYPPTGVSRAYGSRGRIGLSAPEVSSPRVAQPGTAADIAANDTWVQDSCKRLPPDAACKAIRADHDKILSELKRAFREDRPPLEQRERTLASKLAGC